MSKSLDALKDEVRQNRDAVASAVALINGIADRIVDATSDADLDALTEDLRSQAADLGKAVAANTPAQTGPTVSTVDKAGADNSAAGQPATNAPIGSG